MDHDPSEYDEIFEDAGINEESLTVLLVRGGTRAEVLELLGAAETPVEPTDAEDAEDGEDMTGMEDAAYAAAEVEGGVVAFEHTGYADPSPRVLAALSALGGAAAVTRSNIQAHERFGCATDGVLVFDADEFMYVEAHEKESVPAELRPLFDSVWRDPSAEDDSDQDFVSFVGCAMAATHTGVTFTDGDLGRATELGYHRVRSGTYLE